MSATIEAAARALRDNPGTAFQTYQELAEIAVAAVTPLIRAQTLEDIAQMIENYTKGGMEVRIIIGDIRALARALKEQP
jgi:hypothetical protein